jgi:transposase
MPRKPLSDDLCRVLIYMHHKRDLSTQEIARMTSLSLRTVQRILQHFHETGIESLPKSSGRRSGRLTEEHFNVRQAFYATHSTLFTTFSMFLHVLNVRLMYTLMRCKRSWRMSMASEYMYQLSGEHSHGMDSRSKRSGAASSTIVLSNSM